MTTSPAIDLDLAVFLAEVCELTYAQYHHGGDFTPPAGYQLVKPFKCRVFGIEEWFGFVLRAPERGVVAFRGTQSDIDYIGDGDAVELPCPLAADAGRVHQGFLSIYDSCRPTVMDALKGLPGRLPLCITGHSLGAALATLCAFDAAANLGASPILYNYGSPRVGDSGFVSAYGARVPASVRIYNVHDVVPKLPPAEIVPNVLPIGIVTGVTELVWRYEHVARGYAIDVQKGGIIANHALATYVSALKGR